MRGRGVGLSAAVMVSALLLAAVALGPMVFLVMGALQPAGGKLGAWGGVTTANVEAAWTEGKLAGPLMNSVVVTLARAGLNVLLAALAAYPLARMRFAGRRAVFLLVLATTMIPEQVIVVPMFRITSGLGLFDTLAGVVVPFSVSAFGIFLCRQAFLQVPGELEEAARVDGAGSVRVWWSVMLPLAAPTLATLGLFSVIGAWSDLLWPLVILSSEERFTLPVAIDRMLGVFATNPRVAYAASALALVPVVAVFLLAQRWLKPEMFAGSVKG